jgi:hypothetical protein
MEQNLKLIEQNMGTKNNTFRLIGNQKNLENIKGTPFKSKWNKKLES